MKIKIETPIATLTVDLTEEQVSSILGTALNLALGSTPSESPVNTPVETPVPTTPKTPKQAVIPSKGYTGFLHLKCEHCGKFKTFSTKTPLAEYQCECGEVTPLKDLKSVYVQCKCESKFRYLTNAKDSILTIECFNCGSPVDLEYHEHKGNYQTIK